MLKGLILLPRLPVSAARGIRAVQMSGTTQLKRPKFLPLEDAEKDTNNLSNGFRFRIVSYNILAQVYVKSSSFPHSPSACLKWKARSQAILEVLKSLEADFLCIQELDEYENFYKGQMEGTGYSSIYIQRTGQKRDGCGILYKQGCAELMLKEEIEYNDLVNSVNGMTVCCGNEAYVTLDTKERTIKSTEDLPRTNGQDDKDDPSSPRIRLKRDCVGIMAAFKLNDPSHHIVIVANTHIYWDPEWADVKLAQAKYLLWRLAQFKALVSDKYSCAPSVIVTGDFNSTPGDKVYLYLSGKSSNTKPENSIEERPIHLCSLYESIGGEPPFTNCTPGFTGTLDYVFFSPSGYLKPVGLLELPGPESPDIVGGLPNHHHPSDHLPIGADFEVITSSTVQNDLESLRI
ncbi:carbon catabolite repressor protein 4 homolog 4 [Aristolochia californica]|uniref:carbon catabolite repressor protein 4 homolog 4 n=1 Tax=Aristolochia californica TaxID=171875 RepID=UPI0035E286D5